MPGKQHVFLALLARITDQSEAEHVIASPAKLVNAGAFAAFRSFTAGALDCDGVPGDGVGAPSSLDDAQVTRNDCKKLRD